jgi:hypothetical protein
VKSCSLGRNDTFMSPKPLHTSHPAPAEEG